MRYRIHELSFALPDVPFRDTSTVALECAAPDGSPVLFEIARAEATAPGELGARLDAELADRRRRLRGFELVAREEFRAAEVDGVSASFRSVSPEGAVHHEVAYVPLPHVLFIVRVTGRGTQGAFCRDVLVGAVESIELGPPPSGST